MDQHRVSYWKTTLASMMSVLVLGVLLAFWLVTGKAPVLGYAWPLKEHLFLGWLTLSFTGCVTLLLLAIAAGGGICLYRDGKDRARD